MGLLLSQSLCESDFLGTWGRTKLSSWCKIRRKDMAVMTTVGAVVLMMCGPPRLLTSESLDGASTPW